MFGTMHRIEALPRQPDGEAVWLVFTGGFRVRKLSPQHWSVEPILHNGQPCCVETLSTAQLRQIARDASFRAVAFDHIYWNDGSFFSDWRPLIPGQENHLVGVAQRWSSISGNISRSRLKNVFERGGINSGAAASSVIDNSDPIEFLTRCISLSLKGMDLSIQQVAAHYNEQLVKHMAAKTFSGQKIADGPSATLAVHLHSFFVQMASARDYLGALIARRLGLDHSRIDSLARLISCLRRNSTASDQMFNHLQASGNVVPYSAGSNKFVISGWLEEMNSVRKMFVHGRPYGSKSAEAGGWIAKVLNDPIVYRYYRSIDLNGCEAKDVFDTIYYHYWMALNLFKKLADVSGYNSAMMDIPDDNIVN